VSYKKLAILSQKPHTMVHFVKESKSKKLMVVKEISFKDKDQAKYA